eukprot:s2528_g26.t2
MSTEATINIFQTSGHEVASLDSAAVRRIVKEDGDSIKALKRYLCNNWQNQPEGAKISKISIYRINFIQNGEILSDDRLLSEVQTPSEISLILRDVVRADADETVSFLSAAKHGKAEELESLLLKPIDPNSAIGGRTMTSPLVIAAAQGNLECVKLLLDAQSQVDHLNKNGESAFNVACSNSNLDVAQLLIRAGASQNQIGKEGDSPLYHSCLVGDLETTKLLLEVRADPNLITISGQSPLWVVCSSGNAQIVKLLLEARANQNQADVAGRSPLLMAATVGSLKVVKLLLKAGACMDQSSRDGRSPVWNACASGCFEIVKHLMEARADGNQCNLEGASPLMAACSKGFANLVNLLLEAGVDKNKPNKEGESPLYIACKKRHTEIVKCLIDVGAEKNQCTLSGNSPLWAASKKGYHDVAQFLLESGVDKDKANRQGKSALYTACEHSRIMVGDVLLKASADVGQCALSGLSPLGMACKKGSVNMVDRLLQARASTEQSDLKSRTPLFIACETDLELNSQMAIARLLLGAGASANHRTLKGRSPLSMACRKGSLWLAKMLLDAGAKNNPDLEGKSPLSIACENGELEIAKLLLEAGADQNQLLPDGRSCLWIACEGDHADIVTLLAEARADLNATNPRESEMSPLCLACALGHSEVVRALLAAGADKEQASSEGAWPLWIACERDHLKIARILLMDGAELDGRTVDGLTPVEATDNQETFQQLFQSYSQRGDHWERALQLFHKMPSILLQADVVTYGAAINACRDWPQALDLLEKMKQVLQPNQICISAAIAIIASCHGPWAVAVELLSMACGQPSANEVGYGAAIRACEASGQWAGNLAPTSKLKNSAEGVRAAVAERYAQAQLADGKQHYCCYAGLQQGRTMAGGTCFGHAEALWLDGGCGPQYGARHSFDGGAGPLSGILSRLADAKTEMLPYHQAVSMLKYVIDKATPHDVDGVLLALDDFGKALEGGSEVAGHSGVLEIGTYWGTSCLRVAHALGNVPMTTLELDPVHVAIAREEDLELLHRHDLLKSPGAVLVADNVLSTAAVGLLWRTGTGQVHGGDGLQYTSQMVAVQEDWVSISVGGANCVSMTSLPEPLMELQRRSSCLRQQIVGANGREAGSHGTWHRNALD